MCLAGAAADQPGVAERVEGASAGDQGVVVGVPVLVGVFGQGGPAGFAAAGVDGDDAVLGAVGDRDADAGGGAGFDPFDDVAGGERHLPALPQAGYVVGGEDVVVAGGLADHRVVVAGPEVGFEG
ncbi:hypothetical protein GCM10027615_54200 [Plantactinospora veratri]